MLLAIEMVQRSSRFGRSGSGRHGSEGRVSIEGVLIGGAARVKAGECFGQQARKILAKFQLQRCQVATSGYVR
jgi:DeoR/GlpR family transcriptional regulator of sugar metabolism